MNRKASAFALLLLVACVPHVLAQSNWAERLGYPAGKRVVILHGNDMGMAYEFSRPVEQALEAGRLTSASVMTVGPWFPEVSNWARSHSDVDLGVTLTFVIPSDAMVCGPVLSRDAVPSLTGVDGHLPRTTLQFGVRADAEHVRQEAVAQIERARTAGIRPTHLHPHLGTLLSRPDLLRVYLDLAVEYWVPAVMVEMSPQVMGRLRERGFELDDETIEAISRYPLPKVDDIRDVPAADSYEQRREEFFRVIQELEPGITQIFLHPADDSPGLRRLCDKWQLRVWDEQLLTDPEVEEFLREQEIVLTNWREIMRRFEAIHSETGVDDE